MHRLLGNLRTRNKLWLMLVPTIAGMLALAVVAIAQLEQTMLDDRKAKTRNLVEVAFTLLAHYGDLAERGELERDEAQRAAIAAVKKLRYDKAEYFWINDMHPFMVMHPYKPELDGTDLSGYKDPTGNRLFVAFADIARAEGEGFWEYLWPKPGMDQPVSKISYVKGYQPWGWVIGSGIYLDDVQAMVRQEAMKLALLTVLFLILGVVTALALVRNLTAPIEELERAMREVESTGDLTRRAAVERNDELGRMSGSFNRMLEGLGRVFGELHAAVALLRGAATRLTTVTDETRQSMEEQRSGTDQAATAINQMAATNQEVAASAGQAASAAQAADEEAREGARVVTATIEAIDGLAQEVERAAETIHRLETDSENIGTVLNVIRSIAEQTNLLALNAAFVAARAGEHGRGFAVVADEVRTLARRTQESTQEIQAMIESLQSGTRNAVQVMTEGRSRAARSVEQAALAGQSLENIATAVSRINDMTTQIATATEEQSVVSEEINGHVTNIARVADRTADGAISASAAAGELRELAEKLATQVARYRAAEV